VVNIRAVLANLCKWHFHLSVLLVSNTFGNLQWAAIPFFL
jgi:hypothetical protein